MAGVKTAISLDEELFAQANRLAHELHVSRSRLFTMAIQDFLKNQENRALLARLNNVYRDQPDDEEQRLAQAMKARQKKIVGQEPW